MTPRRRTDRRGWAAVAVVGAVAVTLVAAGCGGTSASASPSRVARNSVSASPPAGTPSASAAAQAGAGSPAADTGTPGSGGSAAPPAETAPHNNKPVLVLGDSLAEGTMYYLPSILKGHPLTSRYHIGYALRTALPWLEQVAPTLPPIVVVNLGNNDAPVPSLLGPQIRKALDALGNRCVIWPTIVARGSYNGYPWANFNKVLLAETANRPNVNVLDWVSVVAKHQEWLASDGIHVSGVGYQTRAHLVAAAIDRCP